MVWKAVRCLPPSPAPSRAECDLPAAGSGCLRPPISKNQEKHCSLIGEVAGSRCLRPPISKNQEKHCSSIGEVTGSMVAGCAALCCCCPCGLVNILLAVAFKLPSGLLKRALRRRRKRRAKISIWKPKGASFRDADDLRLREEWLGARSCLSEVTRPVQSPCPKMVQLDEEMVAMFRGAGFWRSHSQSGTRTQTQILTIA